MLRPFMDRVRLLLSRCDAFGEYLGTLSPEAWSHPSACTEWTVADVVAHLAGGIRWSTESMDRGRRGESGPPPPPPAAGGESPSARIAREAIRLRQELGGRVRAYYLESLPPVRALVGAFRPEDEGKTAMHIRRGPMPMGEFLNQRLAEVELHAWDVRSRLAPGARLDPAAAEVLAEWLGFWLPFIFHPGEQLPRPIRYRVEINGRALHDALVDGLTAQVGAPAGPTADVLLHADPETYVLMAMGRLPFDEARQAGRLQVQGNPETARAFTRWFWPT
ncbi:MAG: maleylpyruvate isomerase family mycothiol-dependent enzyme [Deltaproteobacteria bacterium]|nr:maleylpyruvate isomerase family mycothiol-dependent enzyme [Deltaproteobacteria bacterium]